MGLYIQNAILNGVCFIISIYIYIIDYHCCRNCHFFIYDISWGNGEPSG